MTSNNKIYTYVADGRKVYRIGTLVKRNADWWLAEMPDGNIVDLKQWQ